MGFPLFRFTLSNDIEGSLVISEPGGWDEATLTLERNPEFHSLVELYDQPLTFYGSDNANNGGIDYIRNIEETQGLDAQISILIEVSNDEGDTYETVFEGILDIESAKEIDFYKLEMGINRNDFWQKFISRKDTPIDLASAVDLDGEARTLINDIAIQLPSQAIRLTDLFNNTDLSLALDTTVAQPPSYIFTTTNDLAPFDLPLKTIREIEENYNYPAEATTQVFEKIIAKYGGSYHFVIDVFCADGSLYLGSGNITDVDLYIQKNDDTPIAATRTIIPGNTPFPVTPTTITRFELDETLDLVATDFVTIYWEYTGGSSRTMGIVYDNSTYYDTISTPFLTTSTYTVEADTIYDDTTTPAFYLHDAFNSITDRIIGRDGTFYSEYLGNLNTQIQNYSEIGCGSNYALARFLNIRGYTLSEKPFTMSFDTCWNGANPILNLGLGYERIGSPELEVLRVELKSYFYDETRSIDFDFVNNIERSYDLNYVFKLIEIGYEKWSAETSSGIDDPQTKHIYNTRFKTVGKEIRILSKFIGASLVIEQARRNRSEKGKDFTFDNDVAIIALKPDSSPAYQPELDENFTSITNLLNADTRYNIRVSVARNFERWLSFFNGCLQWYASDEYKFASGEGNFDMTSTLDSSDCEAVDASPEPAVDESGDINVTEEHLFMPIVYNFEHPLTWDEYKTIRDNRNNAIGVSRTDTDHKTCFIMNLEYQITHRKGIFTVAVKETTVGFDGESVYFESSL